MSQKKDVIIKVSNLTKKFKDFKAVDNISFEVKKGEIFAFLGPNGAGKSTTIKILTTLLKQDEGSVIINGFDNIKDQDDVRKSFGIIFQDPSLDIELTAYENMNFHAVLYNIPKNDRKNRIETLLDFVGLKEWENSIVKTFSGGMKRRLEIARGLLHKPNILFLDEPTLGLDTQTRRFLWKHLEKIKSEEKMTIFMTTHYLDEAQNIADKIVVIDRGKIVAYGNVKEIEKQTNTNSLEEAYLKLTGSEIRKENANKNDFIKMVKGGRR
ncbi:MAG: ABC transporter ATP-binding protein [Nanoarchaeota archaeon]